MHDQVQPYLLGDLHLHRGAVATPAVEFPWRSYDAEVVGDWYVARKVPVDKPEQQDGGWRTVRQPVRGGFAPYSRTGFDRLL